ncbi:MAG: DinB family protein [Planctomycetes bacterium]|nr:DinB family protein [Planctomycetota bacterium]
MQRQTIVRHLRANRDRILRATDLPESAFGRTYGPGKWSVRQLLAHLADTEFIGLWRFCRAVAEPGATVESFDEPRWASGLGYDSRPTRGAIDLFASSRATLLHYAETLDDARLANACRHPEKGLMTGWDWLALIPAHADHHVGQIEAAAAGTPWQPQLTADSWKYGAGPRPT